MAYLWPMALIPRYDESGNPLVGAKAYFFDAGTTTPMLVYTDPTFSIPHDHPVVANGRGAWPAVFIEEGKTYRLRTTDADDVTLDDVDGISVPTLEPPDFPDSDTPPEQLFQTGDMKVAWRTAAPNGWVRCNGRTIGAAASGATERANADCEDLFIFLWNNDANLAVSGGRGGTANGDWAGGKQIALPDFRGRVPAGLDSFGSSASGRITDAILGVDSDTLGLAGGAQTHALITAELASHTHPGTTDNATPTTTAHAFPAAGTGGASSGDFLAQVATGKILGTVSAHAHPFTTDAAGSGDAHNNLQPTILVPFFIKL